MNCVDLRGVGTGTSWGRREERETNFYLVPKFAESREAHRGPSLRGSTSGNLLGKNRGLVEIVRKERQSRDGWRNVRTDWSVPGTQTARTRARRNLVRSLTRVRPSNLPSLVGEYPGTDRPGGDTAVARPHPPGEKSEIENLKNKTKEKPCRRMRGDPVRSPQTERPVLMLCTRLRGEAPGPRENLMVTPRT